jgi:DNA-binding XRE family transcriptional regulator
MKDRIKKVMESQHMSQQVFADFIGLAPATLSGIFNDRTRPTLNVVEAIKKKIPNISTDWLMFGTEPMFVNAAAPNDSQQPAFQGAQSPRMGGTPIQEAMLDFGQSPQPLSPTPQNVGQSPYNYNGVRSTRPEIVREEIKYIDKHQRRVTEIRVYYDDQTWESFVPSKK